MFTPVTSRKAQSPDGAAITIEGWIIHCKEGERLMGFPAQLCAPLSREYEALYMIYFPLDARWQAPHHDEQVDYATVQRVKQHLIEGLHALNCEAEFTLQN